MALESQPSRRHAEEAPSVAGSAITIFIAVVVVLGGFIWLRPYAGESDAVSPTPASAPAAKVEISPRAAPAGPLPPAAPASDTAARPTVQTPSGPVVPATPTAPNLPAVTPPQSEPAAKTP